LGGTWLSPFPAASVQDGDANVQEPELHWIKADRSTALNACVELACDGEQIALRNSRQKEMVLLFTQEEIGVFLEGAKNGEFDHLIDRQS
jgi:Domain of unknown function (DUF397)